MIILDSKQNLPQFIDFIHKNIHLHNVSIHIKFHQNWLINKCARMNKSAQVLYVFNKLSFKTHKQLQNNVLMWVNT